MDHFAGRTFRQGRRHLHRGLDWAVIVGELKLASVTSEALASMLMNPASPLQSDIGLEAGPLYGGNGLFQPLYGERACQLPCVPGERTTMNATVPKLSNV